MENLIAVVIGLVGTYAVSLYFGRQTDRLIASCSSRTDTLIVSEAQNTREMMDRIVVSEAQNTRDLMERITASEAQNTRDLIERLDRRMSG
jgi:hypothetical protein